MNRFVRIAGLAILGFPAVAATLTTAAATVSPQQPTFSQVVNLPSFDPSLGTLTGVSITVTANFSVSLTVFNFLGVNGASYTDAQGSGSVNVTGPAALNIALGGSTTPQMDASMAQLQKDVYNNLLATGTQTLAVSDFSDYTCNTPGACGSVTIPLTFTANDFSAGGVGSEGLFYSANGTAGGSVQINYTYTPPLLSIAKGPASATVAQNGSGSFTLTVTDNASAGPVSSVTPITVTDPMPAGLTITGTPSGASWTCGTSTATTVNCTISQNLSPGASYSAIAVNYTVNGNAAAGTVTNTASVSCGCDPGSPHMASAMVTVPPSALLTITKGPASATVARNGSGSFTLTVANSAAAGASTSGTVTVTDPMPGGLTIGGTPSGTGWTCVTSTQTNVICTTATIEAPGASFPPIAVNYTVNGNAPTGTVTNTASVTCACDPTSPHTSSAVVTIPAPPIPDLTVFKTHTGTSFVPGGSVTFTVTTQNVGTGVTNGVVTVTDTLPAGLTATSIGGTGWTCVLATVSCTRSDVLFNGFLYPAITLVASIAPAATGTLVNNVVVGGGSEVNLTNDAAHDSITLSGIPDMTITKTHTGTMFSPGGSVTFTMVASNVGSAPTSGTVTVTDALPAGLTLVSISGTGWACSGLSCSRSDVLASGAAYPPISLVANIAANATGTLVNNVAVGGGGEINLTNDNASDSIPVMIPDLTISKSHTGTGFMPGGSVTFTLNPSNIGAGATNGTVTVTDILPTGLTATAITAGAPWSCTLSTLSCTTTAVLASGAAYPPITVTANIGPGVTGTLVNSATVAGGNEVNLTNDKATDPIVVTVPDMTITKTHTGTSFTSGGSLVFTLTASNVGTASTTGVVTVTDTLPAGLTATTIAGGSGWTCVLSSLSCSISSVLAPGAAYPPITVTATIASSVTETLVNNAVVGGGGEINLTNDTATDSIVVAPPPIPDLTIAKTHAGSPVRGGSVTYTLSPSNVGLGPTVGTVTVTDTLPTGLTATAIGGGANWTCTLSPLACTTTTVLAASAAYPPITLTASIAPNAPMTVTNTAVVGGGGEVNLTNDTATDTIAFTTALPNLLLSKNFVGTAIQGGTGTYTLVVTNNGAAPTNGLVTLMDPLATGLEATGISGYGWTCMLSTVTCTRNDALAPGASYPTVSVLVLFLPNAPSTIMNTATVSGGGTGGNSSSNANITIPVAGILPTVTITKTSDRSSAVIGDVVGYSVVVNNQNSVPYANDTIQDTLPAGFTYVQGSASLVAGTAAAQPIAPAITGNVLSFALGTFAGQQIDTVTYRVRITPQAAVGEDFNSAQWVGVAPNGGPGASQIIRYGIMVSPSVFTRNQFLIGRVFEDRNGNGAFDKGERPFAGVRIILSNGASASTDTQGLYNIPIIAPGTVVVSIDPTTIPKGYVISSGGRLDAENTSRLVRTPLQGGAMLRQNFALKKCDCALVPVLPPQPAAPSTVAASTAPIQRMEIIPQQTSLPADGRSTMHVVVRVYDDQGKLTPAKEIRVRTNAGQFVPANGTSVPPAPGLKGAALVSGTTLFGNNTQPQIGRTTEQVPETLQASVAKNTQGEATFLLMAPNQPGEALITAETGDPEHRFSTTYSVTFMPENPKPVLSTDGEVAVGRAAPDRVSYNQNFANGNVSRHGDIFLRTPLGDGFLFTAGYTSHLTINGSNGNPGGLFQLDPLDRVYQVFGDSSTQYQYAQSNSHVYARIDKELSYALFGDIHMSFKSYDGNPRPSSQGYKSDASAPAASTYGVGDYNRNLVGAAIHLEDKRHDSITLEGARPNSAFARDTFSGSTFGLIQLSHTSIVPGSETGTLEVRDRQNPSILLSTEQLVRSVDYTIDPGTGSLFFLRTLNAYDETLDLIQLVFTYEYLTFGKTSNVYGVRGELRSAATGTSIRVAATDQRDPAAGDYYLGDVAIQQKLPDKGNLSIEVPVSHGSALAAGFVSKTTTGSLPTQVDGTAIRADLTQPFPFLSGRFLASYSKTDADFFNPFGTTVVPGSETGRGAVELKPFNKKTQIKLSFTDEINKTLLVNNRRKTGALEVKQFLTKQLSVLAGYDYRDFNDILNTNHINSNEIVGGLDFHPTSRFSASVRREENLGKADPTYPNQTVIAAKYQATETVKLFATERLSSAPIVPIEDLSNTGFATPTGKNETSIGIEDKWSKYTSIQSGYLIDNGINGTDSYAVLGLVNRIPLSETFHLDLGMERGQLLTGKDGSFNSGTVGFSWLPTKNFRTATRYELRDRGGLGQIITTGGAGRISDGFTMLGRYQYSNAAFQPGSGAVDLLSPLSVNPVLNAQNSANQGTAALAWRSWKTDRVGWLLQYTLQSSNLTTAQTVLPQNDRVGMLSTDAYYQPHRRIEFYGRFAFSDRTYNYLGAAPVSNDTYLYQGRVQFKISRRFDLAGEARYVMQPDTGVNQSTADVEAGFWIIKDLRIGVGYNFKSANEIAANFLTNPVRQGAYFVLSTKLSNMFNLFNAGVNPGDCNCVSAPPKVDLPKPVAAVRIQAVTGAHDVCPNENLALTVQASGWMPDQTPAYQWFVDGQPVEGATSPTLMLSTAAGSGRRSITVKVTAGESATTSDPVAVTVLTVPPPAIRLTALPAIIPYGDKATLQSTAQASSCALPPVVAYTASEGTLTGTTFDSSTMQFDLSNRSLPQSRVVHFTATVTDRIGQQATATADVTVTLAPVARRLDDIVFARNSDRVNNCGKRLLIEELTPLLRADPGARVVLIGHRDTNERDQNLDENRVLNAAAVLSAGKGICPQLDLSRTLTDWVGADQSSQTRPALCGSSTNVRERAGQEVSATDQRAQFRRVEIWFIPSGAPLPSGMTSRELPQRETIARGCPR